ncbi:lytic transglycosylase domain-containing protein [Sphingosinicellaceae bacterium]|nr:lytic transglycosylase domain-containing protein [Sphingosinicellaceae bacterium]
MLGPDIPDAALTTVDAPVVPIAFRSSLSQAAERARVSPNLLAALVWQESRWHAAAVSPKGARGLTQLMPGTAHALAVDPGDAAANLAGGARYLRTMLDLFDGNVERALAAYNAGPGRVLRTTGLPAIAETRAYVTSIIDRLDTTSAPSCKECSHDSH